MTTSNDTIPLARYLFEKIREVGVHSIFGVPGDFNLVLLDYIKEIEGLRWVGNANELNAGYETDGYSRTNGFGCLITTFGVGELSAVNAVAGAYAEHVPLIHIVGMPSVSAEQQKLLLHHTLGNQRFDDFTTMSQQISIKLEVLKDLSSAPAIINDLIETAYITKRPVYLGIPSNFFTGQIPKSLLDNKLKLTLPPNDEETENEFVSNVLQLIENSERPIVLVDACASAHQVIQEVKQIAKLPNIPVFTTPMGKGTINEDADEYYGIYVGALSAPDVKEYVESSDCVLSIGGLLSDFNTGSFSYSYSTKNVVEFHSNYCKFKKATYEDLQMKGALQNLIGKLSTLKKKFPSLEAPKSKFDYKTAEVTPKGQLTLDYLWKRLSYFLHEGDVVVTETGTSNFGVLATKFPKDTRKINQVLYGSIGYSLPAAVGAQFAIDDSQKFANKDKDTRVVLFIGDGSLQLTVQAISDVCRWNLSPYIFVVNNGGYTIEKLIHGPTEDYNQIQTWDHQLLLKLFADKVDYESLTVSSCEELNSLFKDAEFNKPSKIRLIELMVDEMDAPESLVKQAKLSEQCNE